MKFTESCRKDCLLNNLLTEKVYIEKKNSSVAGILRDSYLPINCKAKNSACPKTTHVIESVRMPLIDVIEPFGTSVFNTAFVFLMTEKHNRKFTINESMRD